MSVIVAIKPCGCIRGWIADIQTPADRKLVSDWITDGCTVGPVVDPNRPTKCEQHRNPVEPKA